MKMLYPILIERGDSKTAWGITVPDLPGCFSAADEEKDIFDKAEEAIYLYLEDMEHIPQPKTLLEYEQSANDDLDNYIIGMVKIDLSKINGPAKRINITVPISVLTQIDKAAKDKGMNRSEFLCQSALENVG